MARRPALRSVLVSGTAIVAVTITLSGCSMIGLGGSDKPSPPPRHDPVISSGDQTIWTSNGAFVRVEAADGPGRNAHPAKITGDQIKRAFSQLKVKETSEREPMDLMTPEEIALLAIYMPKAFAAAGPNQDVTFASIGLINNEFLLKSQKVTTGRMFWNEAGLNLILGQVHEDARETDSLTRKEDDRLHPYTPGSRTTTTTHKWDLIVGGAGISAHDSKRDDWIVFATSALTGAPPLPNNVATPQPYYAPAPAPGYAPAPAPGYAPAPSYAPPASQKSIEERLQQLEELRRKGLVTDDEAKEKRKQILDGL